MYKQPPQQVSKVQGMSKYKCHLLGFPHCQFLTQGVVVLPHTNSVMLKWCQFYNLLGTNEIGGGEGY